MSNKETVSELQQGDIVACDECLRARPIETPVQEIFGVRIAFGPGGEKDAFVERDGHIQCYRCSELGEVD